MQQRQSSVQSRHEDLRWHPRVLVAAVAIEASPSVYHGARGESVFRRALQSDDGGPGPDDEVAILVPEEPTVVDVPSPDVDFPVPNDSNDTPNTGDGGNEGTTEQNDSNDNENIPEPHEEPDDTILSTDDDGNGNQGPDNSNDNVPDLNAPVPDEQIVADSVAVAAVEEITTCFTIPDTQIEFTTDVCIQERDSKGSSNILYRLDGTYFDRAADPDDYVIKYLCNCGEYPHLGFTAEFTQLTVSDASWTCYAKAGEDVMIPAFWKSVRCERRATMARVRVMYGLLAP